MRTRGQQQEVLPPFQYFPSVSEKRMVRLMKFRGPRYFRASLGAYYVKWIFLKPRSSSGSRRSEKRGRIVRQSFETRGGSTYGIM